MNRRRYNSSSRFDKSTDSYNRKEYNSSRIATSNSKDDYRGRYSSSTSKYFDDSNSYRRSYKDSRFNHNFLSTHRRNDRPKTPPPPSIRTSGSSYNRGGTHRNDNSMVIQSYRNSYSPSRRRTHLNLSRPRNATSHRYNNTRNRPTVRRDPDNRPKIIRRKIIVSTTRKMNTFRNDRSRIIRLARIKRNRDPLKSKTTQSKKSSIEDDKNGGNDEEKKEKALPNNECEEDADTDGKSTKKNGQDEKEEDDKEEDKEKSLKENKETLHLKKSVADSSTTRRHRSTKRESTSSERKPKPFIKLICVHCRIKCRTFSEYQNHLYLRTHRMAMRRINIKQKTQLSRMRLEQRNAQRELEENTKEDLGDQQYCLLCRLNYKTGKAKHQISDHHKTMKKFLMPYCSTCHIAFKSPTVYQSHRCSLDHIKRKARDNKSDSEESGTEMKVDLKDFTTVDSIGEIDDDDLDASDIELNMLELDDESLGIKHVKKVEALYCETCENYISQDLTNEEETILKHCRTKIHLKLFRKTVESTLEEMEEEPTNMIQTEDTVLKKENTEDATNSIVDIFTSDKSVDEGAQIEKLEVNDEEDYEDETILNIDILSEKNCKDNGIIEEAANNVTE
ncbi:hypothetical protein ACFFRR_005553 [Megaselia abdita]